MTSQAPSIPSAGAELAHVLHSPGPSGDYADKLMLFGQFVGSWDAAWTGIDPNGNTTQLVGEVHFGWVLGGRAVQDTWIVPSRQAWDHAHPAAGFYGTTIRFYDPTLDAWRSTWIDPPNCRVHRFIGRAVEQQIVLLSDEASPQLRWRFTEISAQSFRWQGEISHDATSWILHQDIQLRRVSPR